MSRHQYNKSFEYPKPAKDTDTFRLVRTQAVKNRRGSEGRMAMWPISAFGPYIQTLK